MSTFEGADELAAAFRKAGSEIRGELRKTLFKGAQGVKKRAQASAPKQLDTSKISHEMTSSGGELMETIETKGVGGAIFEFGTPTLPGGRPFMLPALEPEESALPDAVQAIVERLLP